MNKITESHLSRKAYVYVRQSTQGQVLYNRESRRRQYSLQHKARDLGWHKVVVIDEDLGKSASGSIERTGLSVYWPESVRAWQERSLPSKLLVWPGYSGAGRL